MIAYRQAIKGIDRWADWIGDKPTVILGDFNDNKSFEETDWPALESRLQPLGLVSAYHHMHPDEPFGGEKCRTYFHLGKDDASAQHLDYCFLPREWAARIVKVDVRPYAEWRSVSDHVPLVVDLDM